MNIEIAEYKPEDTGVLKDLIAELQDSVKQVEPLVSAGVKVRDSYTDGLLNSVAAKNGCIFLAKEAGVAVGCVVAYVSREDDEDVEFLFISDLSVTKNARGKGIGRLLLKHAEGYAADNGLHYIRIASQVANEGATRLYRNAGFQDYLIVLQKKI